MITYGLSRSTANHRICRVLRMIRWGVALVHGSKVVDALRAVHADSAPKLRAFLDTGPMNSRVHPKHKTKYRVSNWPEYERGLVQRGDLTF
ncbi:MAG: hypothetical protein ACI835_005195 [Planctomycetota bacterium]|jgi:hypothetical protein